MKKKIAAIVLGTMLMGTLTACGAKDGEEAVDSTEQSEVGDVSSVESETADTEAEYISESRNFQIKGSDYVVSLCDYKGVPVTLTRDYSVERQDAVDYLSETIDDFTAQYGGFYLADDTKTQVGAGDVVNVDYVGTLDGEAFTGGSATDQNIDVDNNRSVGSLASGGYIDGFTDGLKGAKVGDTIESKVTFPADYGNTELAGKEVVFTFTVNSVQKQVTIDNVDDAFAKDQFRVDTVEEMWQFLEDYLTSQAQAQRGSDINGAIQDYMLANCELNLPEDYLTARLNDYRHSFIESNCGGDESQLESYLSTYYGVTLEEAQETWERGIREQVGMECIMDAVADKEGITFVQEEYDAYVKALIDSGTYQSQEDIYYSYGYGDTVYGENYTKALYLSNLALDVVKQAAVITENVAGESEMTGSETTESETTGSEASAENETTGSEAPTGSEASAESETTGSEAPTGSEAAKASETKAKQ